MSKDENVKQEEVESEGSSADEETKKEDAQETEDKQIDKVETSGESSGEIQEDSGENPEERKEQQISTRSTEDVADVRQKRQMFSNANSGPNGDSVIFVHPSEHGTGSPAGLGDLAGGHGNPLEGGNPAEPFGDLSSKAFGEGFSPNSFPEGGQGGEMGAGGDSLAGLAGASLGGAAGLGGNEGAPVGANSYSEGGSLGGLGGQSAPEGELGGLGGLGGGMSSPLTGGLGGEEARSSVPRSFIPRRFREVTRGYLTRNPLDDGRKAPIVKKTQIPQPGQ